MKQTTGCQPYRHVARAGIHTSPGFILSLILLLLNDHLLKSLFPGFLTGKLSDFAGVFLVSLLLLSVRRIPAMISLVAFALFFIWWKSPWSTAFIATWNQSGLWSIQRVVDAGDLFALLMLPLGYLYYRHHRPLAISRVLRIPVVAAATFAIAATSAPYYTTKIEVPAPEPTMTHQPSTGPICDITLLRDLDRIIRARGFVPYPADSECSASAESEFYQRDYLLDGARTDIILNYDKNQRLAILNAGGYTDFQAQAEQLRRSIRDELILHGYYLSIGDEIIHQQLQSSARLVITPSEQADPFYPSHGYDLLRLPTVVDTILMQQGFTPVTTPDCGNDAYYGSDRICEQYIAGNDDEKKQGTVTTVSLTAYLIEQQPPMELLIFHFGKETHNYAASLAENIQSALELRYPELVFEVVTEWEERGLHRVNAHRMRVHKTASIFENNFEIASSSLH